MSRQKIISVVGAAIIDDQGRCLVTRRSARMSNPLKWEFPGGKIEPGERPEEALKREIAEELGLDIEVGAFVARGQAPAGRRQVVLDVYLARIVSGGLELREHDESLWCEVGELDSLDWARADVPILEPLRAHLIDPSGALERK